jgi:mannose/cellobiose epimerase-like protein (N-acyl-D-glucosamine 2-epimerase family)
VILRNWFISNSLPLWAAYGVDREYGGFFEKLTSQLKPSNDPRRARLVSRQIFFFAVGELLGWESPHEDLLSHGYSYLINHFVDIEGRVCATCTRGGQIIDQRQHLYDVAFVLLALARLSSMRVRFANVEELAKTIESRLLTEYSNPKGGYFDITTPDMQCANPHMHLFEAYLAWAELKGSDHCFWLERANHLAELSLNRMILPDSGALPEYYDSNWDPILINEFIQIEPGHQFEWSWLLARWSFLVDSAEALEASKRLCYLAENYGVDSNRNTVFECINQFMEPIDLTSRLWQQTERLKAWHVHNFSTNTSESSTNLSKAYQGLEQFISFPRPGLWFDTMNGSGKFLKDDVKASSGYHLACAIETISNLAA